MFPASSCQRTQQCLSVPVPTHTDTLSLATLLCSSLIHALTTVVAIVVEAPA